MTDDVEITTHIVRESWWRRLRWRYKMRHLLADAKTLDNDLYAAINDKAMSAFLEGAPFELHPWQRDFVEILYAHDKPIDIAQVMRANDRRARSQHRHHATALSAIRQAIDQLNGTLQGDTVHVVTVAMDNERAQADADAIRNLVDEYVALLGLPDEVAQAIRISPNRFT